METIFGYKRARTHALKVIYIFIFMTALVFFLLTEYVCKQISRKTNYIADICY